MVNDGRNLYEPLDSKSIRDIVDIRIYDRGVVIPDQTALYGYNVYNPQKSGQPEFYDVQSMFGQFRVHESRCLVFRNGTYNEHSTFGQYLFWGLPEYIKIQQALHDATDSHHDAKIMLNQAVQPILKAANFEAGVTAESGESKWRRILQRLDRLRSRFKTIALGPEDSFEFKTAPLTGIKDTVDISKGMLSAVSSMSETVLWGNSPSGQNATGKSDLEISYNTVERMQKLSLKGNLIRLIDMICIVGIQGGEIQSKPEIKLTFNPLWSVSEQEKADIDILKAKAEQIKVQTMAACVDMDALDPSEARATLVKENKYTMDNSIEASTENDFSSELYKMLDDFREANSIK
jgi:phage-related protein (TIGR01555 family)